MAKIKISRSTVESIKQVETGQIIYWDSALMGFGLRVTKGSKTFIVQKRINGKPVRVKIGNYPQVKPERARKEAHAELGRMALGVNPNSKKAQARAQSVTLQEALEEFFNIRTLKPNTAYNYKSLMKVCFKDWHKRTLISISKDMAERRHKKIGKEHGKAYANFALRVLRAVFNFAAGRYEDSSGRSLIAENPVRRLSQVRAWYKIKRRDDYVKPDELRDFFDAVETLQSETMRDFFFLLLFTGLRRSEATCLEWERVSFKNKTIEIVDTKNDEKLVLPLSDFLYDLLKRRYETARINGFVFPGGGASGHITEPRRAMKNICKKMETYLTIHGLRRTFITIADSLDLSAYAIKRLVNHKMSGDVTAGYIVSDVERLRKPMQQITDYILQKSGIKPQAEIIELHPSGLKANHNRTS